MHALHTVYIRVHAYVCMYGMTCGDQTLEESINCMVCAIQLKMYASLIW